MLKRADEFIVYDDTAHRRGFRVFAQFISGNLCKTASAMPAGWLKSLGKLALRAFRGLFEGVGTGKARQAKGFSELTPLLTR